LSESGKATAAQVKDDFAWRLRRSTLAVSLWLTGK